MGSFVFVLHTLPPVLGDIAPRGVIAFGLATFWPTPVPPSPGGIAEF